MESTSLILVVAKMVGALLLVLGLLLLVLFVLRRLGIGVHDRKGEGLIRILDSKMIAPKKYITVVRVASETVVLGVTEGTITLLSRLPEETALPAVMDGMPAMATAAVTAPFPAFLRRALGRSDSPE